MRCAALRGGVPLAARLCQLQQFAITRVSVKYIYFRQCMRVFNLLRVCVVRKCCSETRMSMFVLQQLCTLTQ